MKRNSIVDWDNCSTIIVGKNASKTGKVLMAHNEDDMGCIVQIINVPAMEHKEGEVLTFADGSAVIPQVQHTYSYMWSEYRAINGEAFADGFLNEHGVAVVSNGCVSTKESTLEHGCGLGYALRRLIAERATSAKEGVLVAAELLKKFGYRSTRSYTICDKEEAWVLQVTVGNQFVAKRVGDDEIFYIPNWLTIHDVDFTDTEHKNYYWSDELVEYAVKNGWYTPKSANDYSDFDFAKTYQGEGCNVKSNFDRSDLAWKRITGGEAMPYTTFSIKAPKQFGVEDLKAILRLHYAELEDDLKDDPTMSPHRYGICRDTTVESTVFEFNDDVNLTCVWRAFPRPCAAPYTPWFLGVLKMPKGYSWMGAKSAQVSHFHVDESEFKYNSDLAYWAFHTLQNVMEFDYQSCQEKIHSSIKELENQWNITKPAIEQAYKNVKDTDENMAKHILTDYTCRQAQKAWDWAKDSLLEIANDQNNTRMNFWRSKL